MFQSLRDLLPQAVRRGPVSVQAEASWVVETCNACLTAILPPGREGDVMTLFFAQEGTVVVGCRNAAAAHFILEREADLLALLSERLPGVPVARVRTRIVSDFHDTME
ncbi:hypothetical protein HY734_01000 [Candidatus Uhrbacteria bacterium]|nr:hypothetical protein [Candidatus Uhrbacteria bacterium]